MSNIKSKQKSEYQSVIFAKDFKSAKKWFEKCPSKNSRHFASTKIIANKFAQLKSCVYICNLKVA